MLKISTNKLARLISSLLVVALILLSIEVYCITRGEEVQPFLSQLVLVLIVFICVGLFFISLYVTKRINSIATTANRIIATRDLSQRIPVDCPCSDLSQLSTILNQMLEEIEQSVNGIRQVSDNIAHDLRTPLTRLRNHIESMRDDPSVQNGQHEQLNLLVIECDGLLSTFNALLRIANIESGRRSSNFHTLNLASVVQDVVDLYEPLASEKKIQLHYRAEPTQITGDKDLLFQAIANLLDNAIKYTPPEGVVVITAQPHEKGARIIIRDTGHGIADEHKEHVFRRFYRVSQCRSQPGSGLGLSLVGAIVKLHQGSIVLSDNTPNGLTVTVTL